MITFKKAIDMSPGERFILWSQEYVIFEVLENPKKYVSSAMKFRSVVLVVKKLTYGIFSGALVVEEVKECDFDEVKSFLVLPKDKR